MSSRGKKIAAGTGAAGILIAIVHVLHGLLSLSDASQKPSPIDIKRVEFIVTDSLGHRDSMDYNQYMRYSDSVKRGKEGLLKTMLIQPDSLK